jgi:hypothetical protein
LLADFLVCLVSAIVGVSSSTHSWRCLKYWFSLA